MKLNIDNRAELWKALELRGRIECRGNGTVFLYRWDKEHGPQCQNDAGAWVVSSLLYYSGWEYHVAEGKKPAVAAPLGANWMRPFCTDINGKVWDEDTPEPTESRVTPDKGTTDVKAYRGNKITNHNNEYSLAFRDGENHAIQMISDGRFLRDRRIAELETALACALDRLHDPGGSMSVVLCDEDFIDEARKLLKCNK